MRPRRVCLVQRGLALRVKPYHQGGYPKRPGSAALGVLLLYAGNPPGDVVHLHMTRSMLPDGQARTAATQCTMPRDADLEYCSSSTDTALPALPCQTY